MAEPPRIKRYALVAESREGGVKRFHLARRLERMERVAELELDEAVRSANGTTGSSLRDRREGRTEAP